MQKIKALLLAKDQSGKDVKLNLEFDATTRSLNNNLTFENLGYKKERWDVRC